MKTLSMWICVIGMSPAVDQGQSKAVEADRDKTGTRGWQNQADLQQTQEKQEPAKAGSFLAERAGLSEIRKQIMPVPFLYQSQLVPNPLKSRQIRSIYRIGEPT